MLNLRLGTRKEKGQAMKLIEAMKEIKALKLKAEDLRKKMAQYCAKASFETNTYPDQAAQINEWMQSHRDTLKRIARLHTSIQRTNLNTPVAIEIDGESISHSIAEWVIRRRELAPLEYSAWQSLTDKGIREGQIKQTDGTFVDIKIVRFFDPATRDRYTELFRSEPGLIDRTLETVNAVTDLLEV